MIVVLFLCTSKQPGFLPEITPLRDSLPRFFIHNKKLFTGEKQWKH